MRARDAGLGNLENGMSVAILKGILTGSVEEVFHSKAVSILQNNEQVSIMKDMRDFILRKGGQDEEKLLTRSYILLRAEKIGIDSRIIDVIRNYHGIK